MTRNRRFTPGLERLGARRPPALTNPLAIFLHPGEMIPPPPNPFPPPPPLPGFPPQLLFTHGIFTGLQPVPPTDPIP